ncbi:hypothetical protein GYMLUDRAFT_64141 [Collybiopsis luxurians FD-317 M1]|uniref:Uncharacterized protein n=1 Tax=Collybiopsis luxurians FD-317 M1 TaxID=944289 RepID=A0A0D0AQK2_9AGAR|nr:hypothetical protein GYMLUDRAFT_64141 [Collybiopsis luxurians FD-317 M1]
MSSSSDNIGIYLSSSIQDADLLYTLAEQNSIPTMQKSFFNIFHFDNVTSYCAPSEDLELCLTSSKDGFPENLYSNILCNWYLSPKDESTVYFYVDTAHLHLAILHIQFHLKELYEDCKSTPLLEQQGPIQEKYCVVDNSVDKYNLLRTDFLEEPPIPFNGFTKEGEIIVFFTEDLTSLLIFPDQLVSLLTPTSKGPQIPTMGKKRLKTLPTAGPASLKTKDALSPPEDKDSTYKDLGNEEEDKLDNELQEETYTKGQKELDELKKASLIPTSKAKSKETPVSCPPSVASIKTLDFVSSSKTKSATKYTDKEAASAKSMPLPSDIDPLADASNKVPTSSLSTKGKAVKVPFASAPSAKLAIPKKMAPSYCYEPASIPGVPSAKVTSLLGGLPAYRCDP